MNKAEKDALIAVLEPEGFDWESPEALAEAVYDKVIELLSRRTGSIIVASVPGLGDLVYGPYWDKNTLNKYLKACPLGSFSAISPGVREGVLEIKGGDTYLDGARTADAQARRIMCSACGHTAHPDPEVGCLAGAVILPNKKRRGGCRCKGDKPLHPNYFAHN